jgi:hypothetical protein
MACSDNLVYEKELGVKKSVALVEQGRNNSGKKKYMMD